MKEKCVTFGDNNSLVGIYSSPEYQDKKMPAIILLNAGILHRVGPNRFYVKLARKIAEQGYAVLRFDQSGIGDSEVSKNSTEYEKQAVCDTQTAMDYLFSLKEIDRFILIGICTGADCAVNVACCDERVVGVVGINGYYHDNDRLENLSSDITASIQGRYYRNNLFSIKSWGRVISGKTDICKIWYFLIAKFKQILDRNKRKAVLQSDSTIIQLMENHNVSVMLVYSEGSSAWDTYQIAIDSRMTKLNGNKPTIKVVGKADHVFTLLRSQAKLLELIIHWIIEIRSSLLE